MNHRLPPNFEEHYKTSLSSLMANWRTIAPDVHTGSYIAALCMHLVDLHRLSSNQEDLDDSKAHLDHLIKVAWLSLEKTGTSQPRPMDH